ncbi:hypothetical protein KL949_001030 [Ogataea haglerorum]|uniref:Uncharacterized protein n=1 Tax=Ogataea haglerorum TaxID=1937702 RepID=A0ABQ7RKI1_9ASCO|nr:hypothetical protein KL951_001349 [Ogataea haglerorum]KAG7710677.1 hypothetical protein KL950_001590 [Ogataea haglerorum]KAG7721298.1 hypothetical protein KL913_001034 [Ogataea haglerorum]KAG7722052.1 hypothetical protein KL949_001030 [Ogataea haglerorum]KAG7732633.1 hypothetical protein KL948_002063 [Ogataea haglerorum]
MILKPQAATTKSGMLAYEAINHVKNGRIPEYDSLDGMDLRLLASPNATPQLKGNTRQKRPEQPKSNESASLSIRCHCMMRTSPRCASRQLAISLHDTNSSRSRPSAVGYLRDETHNSSSPTNLTPDC